MKITRINWLSALLFVTILHINCNSCALENLSKTLSDIVYDYGKIKIVLDVESPYQVLIIEESHNSLNAQIQIAIMLNRLYHKLGLRDILVEGALSYKETRFDSFHNSFDKQANISISLTELFKGELSAVEFSAMIFEDLHLHPTETEKERSIISPQDEVSVFSYLARVSLFLNLEKLDLLTPEQRKKIITLSQIMVAKETSPEEENLVELLKFSIKLNELTKKAYDDMFGTCYFSSDGINEVLEKTKDLQINLESLKIEVVNYINKYNDFYRMVNKRSLTIAKSLVSYLKSHALNNTLVAMNIGACHTDEIVEFLRTSSIDGRPISFYVISPLAWDNYKTSVNMSRAKAEDKIAGFSVEAIYNILYTYINKLYDSKKSKKSAPQYKPSIFATSYMGRWKMFISRSAIHLSRVSNIEDIQAIEFPEYIFDSSKDYYVDKNSVRFTEINSKKWVLYAVLYKNVSIWVGVPHIINQDAIVFTEKSIEEALQQILNSLVNKGELKTDNIYQIYFSTEIKGFMELSSQKLEKLIKDSYRETSSGRDLDIKSPVALGIKIGGFLAMSEHQLQRNISLYKPIDQNN